MYEPGTLNPSLFDGIIVLSQRNEDILFMEEVHDRGIPMVIICRTVFFDAPNVTTDEAEAMGKVMDYLIENGHRKICVIEGNYGLDSTKERRRGWRASAIRPGLDPVSYTHLDVYKRQLPYHVYWHPSKRFAIMNSSVEKSGEIRQNC